MAAGVKKGGKGAKGTNGAKGGRGVTRGGAGSREALVRALGALRARGARPEHRLAETLARNGGLKLAAAESCTGGLLSSTVTDVPGSSVYFTGSIVAYGNEAKKRLLKVRASTINTYGAVSAETAVEMAEGARTRLGSDVAVAITGIAGPGGGSAEKPVGTVFICVTGRDGSLVRGCMFKGSRRSIKKQTVEHALDAVLDFIETQGTKK